MPEGKVCRVDDEAWLEFEGAADWYAARNPQAGADFITAVLNAFDTISQSPLRWPEGSRGTRRYLLRHFPFAIIYVDRPEAVDVIAVAHTSRRPGYWRSRL